MERPEVSVVIAAWNAESFICTAVRSALDQKESDVEVIVVDDSSSDRTVEVVQQIGDPRLRVIRQERNGGPASARNRGFAAASGEWIAVLDADDAMEPERLEKMVAAGRAAGADAVIDDLLQVDENGRQGAFLGLNRAGSRSLDLAHFIDSNVMFSRSTNLGYAKPLFRREFLVQNSIGYDPGLRIGEDYLMLADCLAAGARVVVLPEPLYLYTRRSGSISHRMSVDEIRGLQAADEAFAHRWGLSARVRAALGRRARAFENAIAFTQAVAAIKRGDWFAAARETWRRPAAGLLFRLPVRARLTRLKLRKRPAGPVRNRT